MSFSSSKSAGEVPESACTGLRKPIALLWT
jgi:hypothetical protein